MNFCLKKNIWIFTLLVLFYFPSYASEVKIKSAGGISAPQVCFGDKEKPDIVLDPLLAGTINVEIEADGVPDGTKVKIKFKDEANANPPENEIKEGMATIPVTITAGNAKVLYLETDPYVPSFLKSVADGRLIADSATVSLYHLENDLIDSVNSTRSLMFCCGNDSPYVNGVSSNSKGKHFWGTKGTQDIRRIDKYPDPHGTGFTSTPSQWTAEFFIKILREPGSESWSNFLALDSHIASGFFLGKSPFSSEVNKLTVSHADSMGAAHVIELNNPLAVNKWAYIAIVHDGHNFKVFVDGNEIGSVISDGNLGPNPWGDFGVAAGSLWYGDHSAELIIDEIRISNVARDPGELLANAKEILGNNFLVRKVISLDLKNLKLKKKKNKKEIRLQTASLEPSAGEAKKDANTVALFHFNGTTKDSVSGKALVGDPEHIGFNEGKNNNDNSSVSFEGQDDLLIIKKNLFDNNEKEWAIDFFAKPEQLFLPLPTGIITIDNGEIFAMVSYLRKLDGSAILSASSLDGNNKQVIIAGNDDFPSDKWTHLALVYKNKKFKFLINGKLIGEEDLPTLYKKGDGRINVGSDGGDGIFKGQIDELRISDRARSDAELEIYAKR